MVNLFQTCGEYLLVLDGKITSLESNEDYLEKEAERLEKK